MRLYTRGQQIDVRSAPGNQPINLVSTLLALATGVIHASLAPLLAMGDVRPNLILAAVVAVTALVGLGAGAVWAFVGGRPLVRDPRPADLAALPARTAESDALSKDLKRRGFGFVGSTICYAFMQSVGMVDDHTAGCFRAVASDPAGAGAGVIPSCDLT